MSELHGMLRQEEREREEHEGRELDFLIERDRTEDILAGRICPYCYDAPVYVDSVEIYGRSYGMVYLCRRCHAYVGVHNGTDVPLGRLADAELREAKKRAHAAFDPLWQTSLMSRPEAYAALAQEMNVEPKRCHIGMFDTVQCAEVVRAVQVIQTRAKQPTTQSR